MASHFEAQVRQAEEDAISLFAARMQGLNADDWSVLRDLPVLHRFIGRNRPILQGGGHVSCLRVLCKGWAIRVVELDEQRRQILDFVLPGDVIGLHMDGGQMSTSHVIALTAREIGEIELRELERVARARPAISAGLRHHLTHELSQSNEQIMRLGRMTAYERVCSFLLDIYLRQRQRQRSPGSRAVDFPITQTVVADALGLSVVHVNRQVMQLRREGLVTLNRKKLIVHDAKRLAEVCGVSNRRFEAEPQVALEAAE